MRKKESNEKNRDENANEIECHKKLIMQNYVQIKIISSKIFNFVPRGKVKTKENDIKNDFNLFFASLMERLRRTK